MKYLVFHHQTRSIESLNFSEETLQAINLENRNDEPQILKGFQCITFNLKRSQVSGAVSGRTHLKMVQNQEHYRWMDKGE